MAIAEFSKFAGILSVALSQHHHLGYEMAHNKYKILKETFRENIFDLRFGKNTLDIILKAWLIKEKKMINLVHQN